eukprot:353843-Chlamydomonas_euryale.AAC.1
MAMLCLRPRIGSHSRYAHHAPPLLLPKSFASATSPAPRMYDVPAARSCSDLPPCPDLARNRAFASVSVIRAAASLRVSTARRS